MWASSHTVRYIPTPIRVAVLEGDFAALSLLGFPLGVAIQLQQSNLNFADVLWAAKSSNSGFSVSFFLACISDRVQDQEKEEEKEE